DVRVRLLHRHHQHRLAGELVGEQLGGDLGGELLALRDIRVELVDLAPVLLVLRRQLVDLVLELVGERPVEGGGADDERYRKGENPRRQGDDVVPKVDHYSSPLTEKIK